MNEQELRSLIRAVIARQAEGTLSQPSHIETASHRHHASHVMFPLAADPGAEGRCLIESAVMCNHCGYCKSLGH